MENKTTIYPSPHSFPLENPSADMVSPTPSIVPAQANDSYLAIAASPASSFSSFYSILSYSVPFLSSFPALDSYGTFQPQALTTSFRPRSGSWIVHCALSMYAFEEIDFNIFEKLKRMHDDPNASGHVSLHPTSKNTRNSNSHPYTYMTPIFPS